MDSVVPIRDKYVLNTYLLNLILDKDWIVHVGAYCIRPTNAHDHGQMIDPPDTFQVVCNTPLQIPDKYVFIESYSRQGLDYLCRGVLHTHHEYP